MDRFIVEDDLELKLSELRARIDRGLASLIDVKEPNPLHEAVRYVLEGKGKRFRGVLTVLAAEMYGCSMDESLPVALAMEVFHNFTLVHDDIMDRSDTRRGRETVQIRWDDSTAILCGDYLMGLSYELLPTKSVRLVEMLALHNKTASRLCEGQMRDMLFESREHVSVGEYLDMIDLKTSALIQSSLKMGGLLGCAGEDDIEVLELIGVHLGRAFQIQDDLLDLTASSDGWGKPVGGDLILAKKAFLLLKALEVSEDEERIWFGRIIEDGGLPQSRVQEARDRMQRLGVLEAARTSVIFHTDRAQTLSLRLPGGAPREMLQYVIAKMQARVH
ncbi:MAG: polyprenyl synthetase family protein [Bacteroidetes bacterium]|nr:polyprenyl synthetase family protein [Bacteroidota bacterium]